MTVQVWRQVAAELAKLASACKYIAAGHFGALVLYAVLMDHGHHFRGVERWLGLILLALCLAFAWAGYKLSEEAKYTNKWASEYESETNPEKRQRLESMLENMRRGPLWKKLLP